MQNTSPPDRHRVEAPSVPANLLGPDGVMICTGCGLPRAQKFPIGAEVAARACERDLISAPVGHTTPRQYL